MVLVNLTRGRVVARSIRCARTFRARLVGLLGRRSLAPDEALLIEPCRSVHTCFMRFAIDVVFLDRSGRVVGMVSNLRPFRLSPVFAAAHCAVELPAHRLRETGCREGDLLAFHVHPERILVEETNPCEDDEHVR